MGVYGLAYSVASVLLQYHLLQSKLSGSKVKKCDRSTLFVVSMSKENL